MRWLDGNTDAMDMNLGTLGDGEGQGGLACYSPWGREELDMTWQLNNNNIQNIYSDVLKFSNRMTARCFK